MSLTGCLLNEGGDLSLLHLYVDPDHDGGGDPEGDDAGDDGEVLVHHQVANLGVLPAQEEGKKRNLGTDREVEVKGEKYFLSLFCFWKTPIPFPTYFQLPSR